MWLAVKNSLSTGDRLLTASST
jgi:hypothetical protein